MTTATRAAAAPHPLYARILRRETHSPRSVLAVTLAVIAILVLAWVGTEIVLALAGQPALLIAPLELFTAALSLVYAPVWIVATAGILCAVIGLILVIIALSPGRLHRHVIDTERAATVVDDNVIASALARHASNAGNVDPDNATVSVSHRRADVRLVPTAGVPVNPGQVAQAVTEQLDSYGLRPPVSARVRVAERAKVGA